MPLHLFLPARRRSGKQHGCLYDLAGMLTHHRLAALTNLEHLALHHCAWQVTLAFLITKKLSIVRAIMYWIAQMGGAIIGSFLVKYVRS